MDPNTVNSGVRYAFLSAFRESVSVFIVAVTFNLELPQMFPAKPVVCKKIPAQNLS